MPQGREPAAALYLADGVLTISSDERADPAPIADLIRRMQVHEVDTNWTQCQALQNLVGGTTESSYYMVYRGAPLQGSFPDIHPATRARCLMCSSAATSTTARISCLKAGPQI